MDSLYDAAISISNDGDGTGVHCRVAYDLVTTGAPAWRWEHEFLRLPCLWRRFFDWYEHVSKANRTSLHIYFI